MSLILENINLTLPSGAKPVTILHDISLTFPEGRAIAIVGPSGSGKTSLMMICSGLLKPTKGSVLFKGADLTTLDEEKLSEMRRRNMGIVFQNFHLIPTMTALENVAVPLELSGVTDAANRAAEALRRVHLDHRLTHYPSQLSGGEQQRVAIARALAMSPAIVLADEPTGNLDQETGQSIISLLFERVRGQGGTLILITHDPALAEACDMIVRIKDGKVDNS